MGYSVTITGVTGDAPPAARPQVWRSLISGLGGSRAIILVSCAPANARGSLRLSGGRCLLRRGRARRSSSCLVRARPVPRHWCPAPRAQRRSPLARARVRAQKSRLARQGAAGKRPSTCASRSGARAGQDPRSRTCRARARVVPLQTRIARDQTDGTPCALAARQRRRPARSPRTCGRL